MIRVAIAALLAAGVATAAMADAQRGPAAQGDMAQWFGPDAYPPPAQRAGEQGRVVARLTIDAYGHVTGCAIAVSSHSASLDQATCRIALARATFAPARDRHGRAIASTYQLPVRWVLPSEPDFRPLVPYTILAEMVVDRHGAGRSCTVRYSGGEPQERADCDGLLPPVAGVIAKLPAAMRGHPFVLVSETREEVEGLPAPAALEPGLTVLVRVAGHFIVDTTGRATDCRVDTPAPATLPEADLPCARAEKYRMAEGRPPEHPRRVTETATIAVRPLPDPGGV